jgi:ABC-type lipoprotein release transport system permease subunit
MVYGIQPGDPIFVAAACCAMVITSIAAAYVPAKQAAAVDPMRALRSE